MARKLIINDIDLIERGYIQALNSITERKGFSNDTIYNNNLTFTARNYDNFFSEDYKGSFFYNENLRDFSIKFYDENLELIWDGVLNRITIDETSKTANVECISTFNKTIDKYVSNYFVSYDSSKTPARIAKDILIFYGLSNYIGDTFDYSDQIMQDNNMYISAGFNATDEVRIIDALSNLAQLSSSYCYFNKTKIEFEIFNYSANTNIINNFTISYEDVQNLQIFNNFDTIINNYEISIGNLLYKDTDTYITQIGEQSRKKYDEKIQTLDYTKNIKIFSQTVGRYIGNNYIYRYKEPLKTLQFQLVKEKFKQFLDLKVICKFEHNLLDFSKYLFEIISITNSNDLYYDITLQEIKRIV